MSDTQAWDNSPMIGEVLPYLTDMELPDLKFMDEELDTRVTVHAVSTDISNAVLDDMRYYYVDLQHRGPPPRNAIDSPVNFSVEINSNDTNKNRYLYSHRINRIYVDMECDFSVQFNWEFVLGAGACMWVRSCVVFADEAQAQKRPECCLQHLPQGDTVSKHIGRNVLQSSRPMNTQGVEYHGLADAADSWLSTVVSLTKPGSDAVAHAYKFVCKSSCSSGINRRAIAIIFTLEDNTGHVFGRQTVGARVCSCPRRDMRKDEEAEGVHKAGKKRVPGNLAQPKPGKKIKLEVTESVPADSDTRVLTLPPLEIVGERAALTGLEVMLSMMQQAQDLSRNDPRAVEKYQGSITKLKQTIQDIKDNAPSQ